MTAKRVELGCSIFPAVRDVTSCSGAVGNVRLNALVFGVGGIL
jgi:hypothetical protein